MIRSALILLAISLFTGSSAAANSLCNYRPEFVDTLKEKYGEVVVAIGLTRSGILMESLANMTTGTWTIIATKPNGVSCYIASGQSFDAITKYETNDDDNL